MQPNCAERCAFFTQVGISAAIVLGSVAFYVFVLKAFREAGEYRKLQPLLFELQQNYFGRAPGISLPDFKHITMSDLQMATKITDACKAAKWSVRDIFLEIEGPPLPMPQPLSGAGAVILWAAPGIAGLMIGAATTIAILQIWLISVPDRRPQRLPPPRSEGL